MSSAPWILRTLFSGVDLLSAGRRWLLTESESASGGSVASLLESVQLDGESLLLALLFVSGTAVILAKQAARWAAAAALGPQVKTITASQISDTPLLRMLQAQWLGLLLVYLHCCRRELLHAVPIELLLLLLLQLFLTRALGWNGLMPPRFRIVSLRLWRRWVFLLPADPAIIVCSLAGYLIPRWLFPATTGSGGRAPCGGFDPLAAWGGLSATDAAAGASSSSSLEDRAGVELCAYSWLGARSGQPLGSEAALRLCADVSLMLLLATGIAWPAVQFVTEAVQTCTSLHTVGQATQVPPPCTATAAAAPTSARKAAAASSVASSAATTCEEPECEHCDEDDDHSAASAAPLSLRLLPALHLSLLCFAACWLAFAGSLLWARGASSPADGRPGEHIPLLPPEESACPVPRGAAAGGEAQQG